MTFFSLRGVETSRASSSVELWKPGRIVTSRCGTAAFHVNIDVSAVEFLEILNLDDHEKDQPLTNKG